VGPRAGLDADTRRKIFCLRRESNPGPVRSQTLYRLSELLVLLLFGVRVVLPENCCVCGVLFVGYRSRIEADSGAATTLMFCN
jgi:hypothetical protein